MITIRLIIRELGSEEFGLRKVGVSWQESRSFMAGKSEKQGMDSGKRDIIMKM